MAIQATVSIANNVISVTPDPLPVSGNNINIHWDISTPGWTFPSNGIVITNPGSEFEDPEVQNNGNRFKWKDKNSSAGNYKYAINVTNGSTPLTFDPTIINQATLK